ncbi:hypothetical protein ElyMa_000559400 [Elysia marginata]|uniref:Uncharacterized protein n=1 Tax=Elysia marginata TaxID=1093978 RepID=A0AAV4G202_9GAST|nr:hypothetical protein ElyMa_000559400 [Elysia marginata]
MHHSTIAMPTLTNQVPGGGGATDQQAGETTPDDGLPVWVWIAGSVSIAAVLLLVAIVVVCLIRRKRKAEVAQSPTQDPRSPTPLLHYDTLCQGGYEMPGNNGYLQPGGQNEYEHII